MAKVVGGCKKRLGGRGRSRDGRKERCSVRLVHIPHACLVEQEGVTTLINTTVVGGQNNTGKTCDNDGDMRRDSECLVYP